MLKKPFAFILLFIAAFSVQTLAQTVHFKIGYKPEMKYAQTTKNTIEIKTGNGSQEMTDLLKVQSQITSTTESVTTTGKMDRTSRQIPLTTEITKSENNTGQVLVSIGTNVYGHINADQKLVYDSVAAKGNEFENKEEFFEMVKELTNQLGDTPDTTLNIGDSFSMNSPLNLPVPGIEMKLNVNTKYTLLSVEKNIAILEITQTIASMSDTINEMMQVSGTGKGKMRYNISTQFYKDYNMKIDVDILIKMEGQEMKLTNTSDISQEVVVSPK